MSEIISFGAILGLLGVIAVFGLIGFFLLRSWIKVARPDEALVISGKKSKSNKDSKLEVIVNGTAIVNPVTRRHEVISLRSRQMSINAVAQSLDNITLSVEAVALFKISSDEEHLRKAAERFSSIDKDLENIISDQLEGSLRGVIARMDVQDLMRKREELSQEIRSSISEELETQGLIIDSFQIRGITDEGDYIQSLGVPERQEKWRVAEIAKADSERQVHQRRIAVSEENLKEETEYEKNQQAAAAEVGQARARAEQSERLAKAQAEEEVLQQDIENEKKRLEAEVHAKADADYYQRQREADATAYEQEKRAEAELKVAERRAEAYRKEADADAHATRVKADADAHAEREIGQARAEAIEAEAEAIEKSREAYLANRALKIMPELMQHFAKGYAAIDGLTIIGGNGESSGSQHMATESAGSMAAIMETLKSGTGIDLAGIINGSVQGRAFGQAVKGDIENTVLTDDVPVQHDSQQEQYSHEEFYENYRENNGDQDTF